MNDEGLMAPAWSLTNHAHVASLLDKVFQTVEHTTASSTGSAVNTSLVDGFTSNASTCVQVLVAEGVSIGVSDPGHLTFASTHVGCGYVNAGAKEGLLGQLDGKTSGDSLQLVVLMNKINAKIIL